jgi:hypothetical protein
VATDGSKTTTKSAAMESNIPLIAPKLDVQDRTAVTDGWKENGNAASTW